MFPVQIQPQPVSHMIFLSHMVCNGWFVEFWSWLLSLGSWLSLTRKVQSKFYQVWGTFLGKSLFRKQILKETHTKILVYFISSAFWLKVKSWCSENFGHILQYHIWVHPPPPPIHCLYSWYILLALSYIIEPGLYAIIPIKVLGYLWFLFLYLCRLFLMEFILVWLS